MTESLFLNLSPICFQGDEEDIVIVSLVVDENSKTEFVRKVNRLVVLLSRARLGLYILGNTGYFEGNKGLPRHWAITFDLLQSPATNDSAVDAGNIKVFEGLQTGTELPLCCPLHRNVTFSAKSHIDLKLGYCVEVCQDKLACGHECSFPCHWPRKDHRQHCPVEIDSSCKSHPGKVACHLAFLRCRGAPQDTKYSEIMRYYECPVVCSITLPCSHTVDKPCHEARLISDGKHQMPQCNKKSPIPYTFSTCGHSKSVTCAELVLYNSDPAIVRCEENDVFIPPCGHERALKCWKKTRIEERKKSFNCNRERLVKLPRCGHEQTVQCSTADRIEKWVGVSCEEVGVVDEGVSYGLQDYPCNAKASLRRKCGHCMLLPCREAFAKSTSLEACREPVKIVHPSCGHGCKVACHLADHLRSQNIRPHVVTRLIEGDIPAKLTFAGLPKCDELVTFVRKCGHVEQLPCSEISKPKRGCKLESVVKSPLCGHDIKTPCFIMNELQKAQIKCPPNQAPFAVIDSSNDFSTLSNDARKVLQSCGLRSRVILTCGHESEVECSKLLRHSEKDEVADGCDKKVEVCLPCGHFIQLSCKDCNRHKQGLYTPRCTRKKTIKCWNYDRCTSSVEVECGFNGAAACRETTTWVCPTKEHEYKLNICCKGEPQECPGCSFEKLSSSVSSPNEFTGDKELKSWIQGSVPQHKVEWISRGKLKFIENEVALLKYYQTSYAKLDPWNRPLFKSYRTPCFRILSKENLTLDAFDPNKLVKKHRSMFGIVMTILTKENLRKLSCNESKELVTMNKSQLASFAEKMGEVSYEKFQPVFIKFQRLPEGVKIAQRVRTRAALEDDDREHSSIVSHDMHEARQRLEGTILEGLDIDCSWVGGINSRGILPSSVEKNLIMAAEKTRHSHHEASQSLDRYLELLKASKPSAMLHPWALVIASRLTNPPISTKLIATFIEHFPSQYVILTPTERGSYDSDDDNDDDEEIHETLFRHWNEFKAKNAVVSDATDSLMALIGLRKVKEEVSSLWKSAILLKKMDPEARKENKVVANYVFLGNPGKLFAPLTKAEYS